MVRPCTPLSFAAICCAGTASPSPTLCAAIEHLTRSRAVSRIPGRFSFRFQSSPVRACPRSCLYANWAGPVERIRGVCPPATYAVRWRAVRRARADSARGSGVSASQHTSFCLFPMRPRDHLPRKSGDRAPRGAQSPHWSSRVPAWIFTTRKDRLATCTP